MIQAYTSLLAMVVLKPNAPRSTFVRHLNLLLGFNLAIYIYRDVWPLATFTEDPLDVNPPWFTWASIMLLTVAGFIIPVFIPKEYIPIDLKVCFHLTFQCFLMRCQLPFTGYQEAESRANELYFLFHHVLLSQPDHLQGVLNAPPALR